VVLTMATSVAAEPTEEVPDTVVSEVPEVVTSANLVKDGLVKNGKLLKDLNTLQVNSSINFDLDGKTIGKIEVKKGTLTLANTSTTAVSIDEVAVESGSIVINTANITAKEVVSNGNVTVNKGKVEKLTVKAGTVSLGKSAVVEDLTTDISLTFSDTTIDKATVTDVDAVVKIVDNNAASFTTGTNAEGIAKFTSKEGDVVYLVDKNAVTFSLKLLDEDGKPATGTEVGDYALIITAMYDNTELAGAVTADAKATGDSSKYIKVDGKIEVADDGEEYDKLSVLKPLDGVTAYLIPTFAGTEYAKKALVIPTTIGTQTPNQPEQPENPEQPSNPSDDKKGDLDDAAAVATGDHIIPATALLAVVVVANVVYFAKSKNN
ncbi:MAG: hypothetical protein K2H53_04695, partial [Clostridia bacterium]|nr:hypothetical protein [Clostridia bacterium]